MSPRYRKNHIPTERTKQSTTNNLTTRTGWSKLFGFKQRTKCGCVTRKVWVSAASWPLNWEPKVAFALAIARRSFGVLVLGVLFLLFSVGVFQPSELI